MYPQLVLYLGLSAAAPPVIALVLWVARQHMWRAIAALSLLALALGCAGVVLLTVEYRSLGIAPGFFYGSLGIGPQVPASDAALALLATYEAWRSIAVSGAVSLATGAWIIGIYQAIRVRHRGWLAAIIIGASLSGFLYFFAQSPWAVGVTLPSGNLLATHPFAKVLVAATLPYLSAAVTGAYSLIVLRRAATSASEPVPGIAARPSLAEALNAPPAGVSFEDVVFEVEELPRSGR